LFYSADILSIRGEQIKGEMRTPRRDGKLERKKRNRGKKMIEWRWGKGKEREETETVRDIGLFRECLGF
jgi:hypothetical protein